MTEIKISELSVGDWVKCNGFKATIAGYNAESGSIQLLTKQKNKMWFLIEDIEPIPLTPEILEKNGFVYSKVTRWYNCELKDTQRTRIGVHYGLIGADRIEISSVDAFNEDWSTIDVMINKPIEGVHQLQHALRLAGVENEIEV